MALDPLSTRVNLDAGWLLLQAHRFDEAIRQAQRALELEPGLGEAHSCIARALECQGRIDAESSRRLRALTEKPDSTEPFMYAAACALLDEREKALQALDRAYAARSSMMPLINSEPAFARLHGDARFESLVKKMKLPY